MDLQITSVLANHSNKCSDLYKVLGTKNVFNILYVVRIANYCVGSSVVRAPFIRSGCCGFESRSGHLIFSGICSVYIYR